jgi:hypothetical protein
MEQLKWPLYVLDDVIVAPCARSSQFIRASGLSATPVLLAADGISKHLRMAPASFIHTAIAT